jgi:sigma-54 dependent transcriptional regulator, acetoin dehydrogenase operon transcriptional activator AcoR
MATPESMMSEPLPSEPDISWSWKRSELAGLSRESPGHLSWMDVSLTTALTAAASPVLERLADQIRNGPFCLLLADRECRIVRMWSGQRHLRASLEAGGITVGAGLQEAAWARKGSEPRSSSDAPS